MVLYPLIGTVLKLKTNTMKFKLTTLLLAILLTACYHKEKLYGEYYCDECLGFKTLKIDSEIVSLGLMGNGTYYIKNNRLYVNSYAGIMSFEIVDENTLKSESTIINEGELFRRK